MVIVRNCNGTSGARCTICQSWKNHYTKVSPWPSICANTTCNNVPTVGAHVIIVGTNRKQWIVPFCYSCNSKGIDIELRLGTVPKRAKKCK